MSQGTAKKEGETHPDSCRSIVLVQEDFSMDLLWGNKGKIGGGKGKSVNSYNTDNNSFRSPSRTLRKNPLATMTPISLSAQV
jgi:hypothetical protein